MGCFFSKKINSFNNLSEHFLEICLLLVLIAVVSFGCGSGGGGGGGGDDTSEGHEMPDNPLQAISYAGLTSQAVISRDNAAYIAIGGLQGGAPGTGNSGLSDAAVNIRSQSERVYPRLLTLSRTLERSVATIDDVQSVDNTVASAEYSDFQTQAGECGGMAYYSIHYDDSGNVSGTSTYVDYCDEGVTFSGAISYFGRKTSIYSGDYEVNSGSNKVWLNNGNAGFTDSGQNFESSINNGVAVGDLDGDGDLDAFVAGNPSKVWFNTLP